jgi:hypothetical protein
MPLPPSSSSSLEGAPSQQPAGSTLHSGAALNGITPPQLEVRGCGAGRRR